MPVIRSLGHLRPPTSEQVAGYAKLHHLHLTDADAENMLASITGSLEPMNAIEEADEPSIPLKHPYRDPGRAPREGEDPYNAFIRYCEVRGADSGPLHGKTLGVKDCIAVAGVPTTNGGRRTPAVVPTEDAVVVERLLDAGVTITGKTNLEDMALGLGEGSAFGAAKNPVNPTRSTGGSSSGSGAAVAAGLVDLALGADEGGSVRIPAAWCGLVGMKATHGLVPSYGLSYMDHTLDHIGPMTKTVADNALMLEIMAGSDWRDPQWVRASPTPGSYTATASRGVRGLRVGIIAEALEPIGSTPDVLSAFESGVKQLAALGAQVREVSVPLWGMSGAMLTGALTTGLYAMTTSYGLGYGHLGRVDPAVLAANGAQMQLQADELPWMLKTQLVLSEYLRDAYQLVPVAKAHNLRLELRRQISALFDEVDVLVTPTTPEVAFELLDERSTQFEMALRMQMSGVANTCPLDLTGHPALTVPCGTGAADMPVGLQLIGPHFGEEQLYAAGFALEAAT
jgi:amidase